MGKALFLLVGGDVLMMFFIQGLGLAAWFHFYESQGYQGLLPLGLRWLVLALIVLSTTYLVELYSFDRHFSRKAMFLRILTSLALSLALLLTLYYFHPELGIDYRQFTPVLLGFGVCQFIWHERYPLLMHARGVAKNVLILGVGPLARQVGCILEGSACNYVLAGYVQSPGEQVAVPEQEILSGVDHLYETAHNRHIEKIVISLSERRGRLPVAELLQCRFHGIEVVDAVSFHEETTGQLLVDYAHPAWFIYSNGFRITNLKKLTKRLFDVGAAMCGLLMVMPSFPLIALAIKLDSPGPIFFSQDRVGENEQVFRVYKFRTMCRDAEKATGAVWARTNDARITRIGHWLRKSRLDELPQLFNVLKGDMSLVGPRPERPEFVRQLQEQVPYYAKRHLIKPGLTGWAQVRFPYGASVADALEKLKYDLYYMKHYTPAMDLLILLETVKVVLFGRGGR